MDLVIHEQFYSSLKRINKKSKKLIRILISSDENVHGVIVSDVYIIRIAPGTTTRTTQSVLSLTKPLLLRTRLWSIENIVTNMTKVELDIFQSKQLVLYSIKVTLHMKIASNFRFESKSNHETDMCAKSLNKSLF